jgi:hypothetical protein
MSLRARLQKAKKTRAQSGARLLVPLGACDARKAEWREMSEKRAREGDATCSVCLESLKSTGKHRCVALRCGHVFGKSCISDWIKSKKSAAECPNCKAKCRKTDLRELFLPSGAVVDATELERVREELRVSQRVLAETQLRCSLLEAKANKWDEMSQRGAPKGDKEQRLDVGRRVAPIAHTALDGTGRLLAFHRHDGSVLVSQGHSIGRMSLADSGRFSWLGGCHAAGSTVRGLAAASGHSPLVLSCASDRSVCVWSVESGNVVHSLDGLCAVPMSVAWTDDSNLMFAVAQRNAMQLFDLRALGGGPVTVRQLPWEPPVHSLCRFGSSLVAASLGGAVRVSQSDVEVALQGPVYSLAADAERLMCSLRLPGGATHEVLDRSLHRQTTLGPYSPNSLLSRCAMHGELAAVGDEATSACRIVSVSTNSCEFDPLLLPAPCLDVALFDYARKRFAAAVCGTRVQLVQL